MLFTLPEDARWNAERQAVEFGVEIGEYHGASPSGSCARRQLTEDGNLEIRGRGLAPTADSRRSPGLPQTTAIDPLRTFGDPPAYGLYLGIYYGLYGIADVTTLTGTEVTGK
jgi:hypothetical protein